MTKDVYKVKICCEDLRNDHPWGEFDNEINEPIMVIEPYDGAISCKYCPHCGKKVEFEKMVIIEVEVPESTYYELMHRSENTMEMEKLASKLIDEGLDRLIDNGE